MIRIALVAALLAGCGGGEGGGGGNAGLRNACTKVCGCFEETSSFSNSGGDCVDECVNEASSSGSGPIVSGSSSSSGGGTSGPSQACLDCINASTCDALVNNNACSAECNF